MSERASGPAPSAVRQLGLLLSLWWRHLRRRPMRIGEAPKQSGVPTFLLLNLLSLAYSLPLVFRGVAEDMQKDVSLFAWHVLGISVVALGTGISKGAASFSLRGGRGDEFLAALPLSLLARLGLQFADGYFMLLIALVVALAGALSVDAVGSTFALSIALGLITYIGAFVLGQALIAWARSLGPPSTARYGGYLGAGLVLTGFALTFFPMRSVVQAGTVTDLVARWWFGEPHEALLVLGAELTLLILAYGAVSAAERRGFDRLDAQSRTPRASKAGASREVLESRMIWRQGARVQLPLLSLMLGGGTFYMLRALPDHAVLDGLLTVGIFSVYTGAIQIISHAGIAVRRDLKARAFLAALPLSPYQVLDGKASALRKLLIPMLALLGFVASVALRHHDFGLSYRALLAMFALYSAVDGAISIAFMSSGVGVVGVGGGQVSSSFSTQLLLLPLLATLVTNDSWSASVACLTVAVLSREAQRAARQSVRWLDDPDDAVERETSVWRALLAATVFFTSQILAGRMLGLFSVPPGYTMAAAFLLGAVVLSLLTWRDAARFARPSFLPNRAWFWPLALVGGATTAALSLWFTRLVLPASAAAPALSTRGESLAFAVMAVLIAPLAEEYFFRGWLQRAIEQDLPSALKRWGFAFGALAFALAHVGSYGLPQLMLGLVAGALFARGQGLGPAMLAHAVHNGVALWATLAL